MAPPSVLCESPAFELAADTAALAEGLVGVRARATDGADLAKSCDAVRSGRVKDSLMPSVVLISPRSMAASLSSPPSRLFIILSLSLSLVRGDISLSGLSRSMIACVELALGLPSLTLPAPLKDLHFLLRLELLSDLSVRLLIVAFS